jgi:hypothetical protein
MSWRAESAPRLSHAGTVDDTVGTEEVLSFIQDVKDGEKYHDV